MRVRWLVARRAGLVVRGIAHRGAERGEEYETRIVTARGHGLRRLVRKVSFAEFSKKRGHTHRILSGFSSHEN